MTALLDGDPVSVAGFQPTDLVVQVLDDLLDQLSTTPWALGLFLLIVGNGVVRTVRGIVHGGHGRDPQRTFIGADRAVVFARAGNRCEQHSWLFGRCCETERLQADHVHPHSRGGATAIANGQALCARHNERKAARVPWSWELARLARRREAYFPPHADPVVMRHRPTAGR